MRRAAATDRAGLDLTNRVVSQAPALAGLARALIEPANAVDPIAMATCDELDAVLRRIHPRSPTGASTPSPEKSEFTGSAHQLRSFSIDVHDSASMSPSRTGVPAASHGTGRETPTLVGVGGLCAAVLVAAVATAFVDAIWAAGVARAWLLLFAAVCFLPCVVRLPRRRT